MRVAIINYKINNLSSVRNALDSLGVNCEILSDAGRLGEFDKVILPGVGAFENAINHLNECGMSEAILDFAKSGKYILGICLGAQLLFDKSVEFGTHKGLGLIGGEVVKFEDSNLKIPHMGWNTIKILQNDELLRGCEGEFFYFVHSYYMKPKDSAAMLAKSEYGVSFASVVRKNNIYGIQPHPEKSSSAGLKILKKFVELK